MAGKQQAYIRHRRMMRRHGRVSNVRPAATGTLVAPVDESPIVDCRRRDDDAHLEGPCDDDIKSRVRNGLFHYIPEKRASSLHGRHDRQRAFLLMR